VGIWKSSKSKLGCEEEKDLKVEVKGLISYEKQRKIHVRES